jgi:molybdenum cofactor sulfurtransferase
VKRKTADSADAYQSFIARYPGYLETAVLDELRATEYRRLDEKGQVYLDYTGGSLYAESQIEQHLQMLRSEVFGNPH